MSGFIGAVEKILYNPLVAGSYQGLREIGNCTQLALGQTGEIKTRPSRQRASYGAALDTVAIGGPSTMTVVWDEAEPENIALANHGTSTALAQTEATTQTATVVLILNQWVEILDGVGNLSSITISGETLGTDFEVDGTLGLIKALNADAAGSKTVGYTRDARTGYTIDAGSRTVIRGKWLAHCTDLVTEKACIVHIWDAVLQANGAFDPLSTDWATGELAGNVNKPANKAGAYQIQYRLTDT